MLAALGATAVGIGGAMFAASETTERYDINGTAGIATASAGLAAVAIGIPLMLLGRTVHQPGATTEIAHRR